MEQPKKVVKRKIYVISSSSEDDQPMPTKRKITRKKCSDDTSELTIRKELKVKKELAVKKEPVKKPSKNVSRAIKKEILPTIKKEKENIVKDENKSSINNLTSKLTPASTSFKSDNKFTYENTNKRIKNNCSVKIEPVWEEYRMIQDEHNLPSQTARNIVELFKEGNTIPFIARYRKLATGDMTADQLRDVKCTYDNALELRQKIVTAYNKIKDMGKMNPCIEQALLTTQSVETFEEIYAEYKPATGEASQKQKIHVALEKPANSILSGENVDCSKFVGVATGLENAALVYDHLLAVTAKMISTSPFCLQCVHKMKKKASFTLKTKKINKRSADVDSKSKNGKPSSNCLKGKGNEHRDASNFTCYYDRCFSTSDLKPHQIMAINRAEHLKYLTVSLEFDDFSHHFFNEIRRHYIERAQGSLQHDFDKAMAKCYNNIVTPLLKRLKRAELKTFAEKASLDVFSKNLKQILLAAPVKDKAILGVDPGFAHGCKLGVISKMGELLATNVVYPHSGGDLKKRGVFENIVRDMLFQNDCSLIALGNGTACRETEAWLADMIQRKVFHPLDISYTIVNESGASIYSCSKEAVKEFKDMDPNLISAVSLARRIQDPLSELVKVEPKHLGIGMYQRDVNQKRLVETLDDIVSECVSFVGVDLNSTSQCLLKHVAGLTEKRADEIIRYRQANGSFATREDLLKVKGIGPLTYKQCAGFLKISRAKNVLDTTIIHPESYHIVDSLMKRLNLKVDSVGTYDFIRTIHQNEQNIFGFCQELKTSKENMIVVIEGLTKSLDYDLRAEGSRQPLFRQGVTSIETLQVGMILTGAVTNCTSFGSFVDIGVGINGLIHISKGTGLQIGNRVEVRIAELSLERKRIGLVLLNIIS